MFQNHFESEDPSTINLQEASNTQQSTFKIECNSVLIFIILGFVFLIMAMVELITNYQQLEHSLPLSYDINNNKITSAPAYVTFITDDSVSIYLDFKKLSQFSFTNKLDGENIELFDEYADNCHAYRLNSQTLKSFSITNSSLNPNSYSIPCGKYPSMFVGADIHLVIDNGTRLSLNYSGITAFDYKIHDLNPTLQWTSLQHPLFQNWMQQNVMINTHKLIGKVNGRFEGNVYLEIQSVNGLRKDIGPISVFMTNNRALGGYNHFFCLINFIQSGLMFLFAFLVYVYQKIMKQQVKNVNVNVERKIQLRTNYESQAGKMRF